MKNVITLTTMLSLLYGCAASQRREQYFMVVERTEGSGAIYKATATLTGWGGVKYKLNEGYVPVSVIDALSGKIGEPPDLYSPVSTSQKQAELNDELEAARGSALLGLSRSADELKTMDQADVDRALQSIDNAVRLFGALKSAASMSPSEQISIGQTGSTDIYAYRKLVFYASAQVIKLQEFENELDELQKSTTDIAKAFIQAKQVKADAARAKAEQRGKMRQAVLGQVQSILLKAPNERTAQDFLNIFTSAGLGGAS